MAMTGTMRTGWRVLAVGVVWGAMICPAMLAAKTKLPVPSTWELDLLRWGWAEDAVGSVHGER
jgi:hypothetical protein